MRLILIMLNPDISKFENSIDPDQLASRIFINTVYMLIFEILLIYWIELSVCVCGGDTP